MTTVPSTVPTTVPTAVPPPSPNLSISRRVGRFFALALLFAGGYLSAFALRFDFQLSTETQDLFLATLPWVLAIKLAVAYLLAGFHGWMRYVAFFDLFQLVRSIVLASLALVVADLCFIHHTIPISILILDFVLTLVFVGGARCMGRFLREFLRPLVRNILARREIKKVLLIGADRTTAVLITQINFHPRLAYRVVGLLDDDPGVRNITLAGVPVIGNLADLPRSIRESGANEVLVMAGSLAGKRLRTLMGDCQKAGGQMKIVTNVNDLVHGRTADPDKLQLRDIDINDLLRRDPIKLDTAAIETLLKGRTVMVTGAGGSIGSEICRQVLAFAPKSLLLVERAENNLFEIDRELRRATADVALMPLLADVTDEDRMRQLFKMHRPEVVIHAAAHKHVPMMEVNPGEAIKNNAFGTRLVADLAHEFGLLGFVMISTDKAVNPSSVMGLSKQLAERHVQALGQESKTRFVVVRFGNVLGSVGSVVPIFQEQIRRGGPVTVTHLEMRRYFMTIPEASQLVLQAAAMGKGGEIFELDMGEPVRVVDLAHDLIRLSGLGAGDIDIVVTGMRPGEKLFEELYFAEEATAETAHPKVRVAYPRPFSLGDVADMYGQLDELTRLPQAAAIRGRLADLFPEYRTPDPTPIATAPYREPEQQHDTTLAQMRHPAVEVVL